MSSRRCFGPWALLLAVTASGVARAEGPDAGVLPEEEPTSETVVHAERTPTPLSRTPAAISIVEVPEVLAGRPGVGLEETLSGVPGVVARGGENYAQDLRLSIRGFGARSAFGIRGVTLVVDGFTETLPDGQAQVDSIDIATAERVEVLRGLSASLYGNAAGGVIRIDSARAGPQPTASVRGTGGSFGLVKLVASGAARAEVIGGTVSVSRLRLDGHRDHARAEQTAVNANADAQFGGGELFLSFAFVDAPIAEDPGGLTREEFEGSPRSAAATSLRFDAGESVRHGRLGAIWRRTLQPGHALELTAFGVRRSFENAIPFTVVAFERIAGGAGVRSTHRHEIGSATGRFTAALEGQLQSDDRTNAPNLEGRPVGDLTLDQAERVLSGAVYLQEELTTFSHLTWVLGGRFDLSQYQVRDRLLSDGDGSGTRVFSQPTGRFGAIYAPSPAVAVYASLSQSFETPTTTELADLVNGGFLTDLEPQRADGIEVGARGRAGPITWEAALFGVRVVDGLVRQEDALGRARFVNAARSRHLGAEAAVAARLPGNFSARASYAFIDARFQAYAPEGVELAGNVVPGIPQHNASAALRWTRTSGGHIEVEALTAGGRFADDANDTREPLVPVVDVRAAWPIQLGQWRLSPFGGVRNLFSARYSDGLRLNANGARYFEPAPTLHVYAGASVGFEALAPEADAPVK